MINDSARILREAEERHIVPDFKYIIVDEYQDISRQRFNLTKELSKLCDAKKAMIGSLFTLMLVLILRCSLVSKRHLDMVWNLE